jgi:hypothetical protein
MVSGLGRSKEEEEGVQIITTKYEDSGFTHTPFSHAGYLVTKQDTRWR